VVFLSSKLLIATIRSDPWEERVGGDEGGGETFGPFATKVEFAPGLNAVIGAHVSGCQREADTAMPVA